LAKKPTEIMEIFSSYDLTHCAWSAAQLAGCDAKTVQRYVGLRDMGLDPLTRRLRRAQLIDPHLEKVEELVERSHAKIRGDAVHRRLRALGYAGSERTTRRAVARAKAAYRSGHRRSYRPWLPEPGAWLQFDWGQGSAHRGEKAKKRLRVRHPNLILVHTPVHASWVNQVEIYFGVVQRKVLTPAAARDLVSLTRRIMTFEARCRRQPKPFRWKFTSADFRDRLLQLAAA
jgi:hypothetical protein